MNKHRTEANKRRERDGKEPLPAGPKYSKTESNRVRSFFEASTRDPTCSVVEEIPDEQLDEQPPDEIENTLEANVEVLVDPAAVGGSLTLGDGSNLEMVRDLLDSSSEGSDNPDGNPDDMDYTEFENPYVFGSGTQWLQMHRAAPREMFCNWAAQNRQWIDLAVKFGTKNSIMSEVLRNLKAPYEAWITIVRNIIKYSGIETVTYLCCQSHMLFPDCIVSEETPFDSMKPNCSICTKQGKKPRYGRFVYIPLLPRVRAWMRRDESLKYIFRYRSENCHDENEGSQGEPVYSDYFDGSLYKEFIISQGGKDASSYEVFIAPSADGFDVYRSGGYDCWPIIALNLNLDPSVRFLMRNVIPLGFVGGPSQPAMFESFLIPMVNEIKNINASGGTPVPLPNGQVPLVRVHVMWVTADMQGYPKCSGHLGPSAKKPCLCCDVPSYYSSESRRYYLPSCIKKFCPQEGRTRLVKLFDPASPRDRIPSETRAILRKLDGNSGLSNVLKARMRKETGVKGSSVLHSLPSIIPFDSFSIDTMHLGYNISKDLIELLKGENTHLMRLETYRDDTFLISSERWRNIDTEIRSLTSTTSQCAFGSPLRDTSMYRNWKAAEYRQFVLNFWLVLLDGHLPRKLLLGLAKFTKIMDLWSRPCLTEGDVDEMGVLSVQFFKHFEQEYFKFDQRRVGLCKLTMHMLLHLKTTVYRCGPPVGYNQFWVERYIGFIKSRLNARAKAAESMTRSALLFEAYKLFFDEPFVRSSDNGGYETTDGEDGFVSRKVAALGPTKNLSLLSRESAKLRIRELLKLYIAESEGLTDTEAIDAVREVSFQSLGSVKLRCGDGFQVVGSLLHGRKRTMTSRGNYFIAAEYSSAESADGVEHQNVHYGKVLMFLRYRFIVQGEMKCRDLMLVEWANNLKVTECSQVYCDATMSRAFSSPTVGDISAIINGIGVLEHSYPLDANFSPRKGTKTFFIDPQREAHQLLNDWRVSSDGVCRSLGGVDSRYMKHTI